MKDTAKLLWALCALCVLAFIGFALAGVLYPANHDVLYDVAFIFLFEAVCA